MKALVRTDFNFPGQKSVYHGKVRDVVEVSPSATEEEVKTLAFQSEKVKPYLAEKTVRKCIYVPGKIMNLVVA